MTAVGSNAECDTALYKAVKQQTIEELHLDIPALPRVRRGTQPRETVTQQHDNENQIALFYVGLCQMASQKAAEALTDRYSANDLEIVNLLRRSLEDAAMNISDLTIVTKFYENILPNASKNFLN